MNVSTPKTDAKWSVLGSRKSPHWATDSGVYADLDREFGFTLDPCALGESMGLMRSWHGERVYCNPPYGRGVGLWLGKAHEAIVSVFLLPSRTDTRWFHEYAPMANEIRFLRGRLRFSRGGQEHNSNAPFPSVLLVFVNTSQLEATK